MSTVILIKFYLLFSSVYVNRLAVRVIMELKSTAKRWIIVGSVSSEHRVPAFALRCCRNIRTSLNPFVKSAWELLSVRSVPWFCPSTSVKGSKSSPFEYCLIALGAPEASCKPLAVGARVALTRENMAQL